MALSAHFASQHCTWFERHMLRHANGVVAQSPGEQLTGVDGGQVHWVKSLAQDPSQHWTPSHFTAHLVALSAQTNELPGLHAVGALGEQSHIATFDAHLPSQHSTSVAAHFVAFGPHPAIELAHLTPSWQRIG